MGGITFPKLLLGKKDIDPSLWRILRDLETGKRKRFQRKTEKRLFSMLGLTSDILQQVAGIPDGQPWAVTVTAFNMGIRASGGSPLATLEKEAVRLETLAEAVREIVAQGDFHAAFDQIGQAEFPSFPCVDWIKGQIDCDGSKDRFAITVSPLLITTTLYLLACLEVDLAAGNSYVHRLLPEMRDGKLIRPMRRWLEGVKVENGLPSVQRVSDMLLANRDVETSRREVRKWWTHGTVPAWSRVQTLAHSLTKTGDRRELNARKYTLSEALLFVRVLNGLLNISLAIRDRHLPDFDALSPFRDFSLMQAHALSVMQGLPTCASSPCIDQSSLA